MPVAALLAAPAAPHPAAPNPADAIRSAGADSGFQSQLDRHLAPERSAPSGPDGEETAPSGGSASMQRDRPSRAGSPAGGNEAATQPRTTRPPAPDRQVDDPGAAPPRIRALDGLDAEEPETGDAPDDIQAAAPEQPAVATLIDQPLPGIMPPALPAFLAAPTGSTDPAIPIATSTSVAVDAAAGPSTVPAAMPIPGVGMAHASDASDPIAVAIGGIQVVDIGTATDPTRGALPPAGEQANAGSSVGVVPASAAPLTAPPGASTATHDPLSAISSPMVTSPTGSAAQGAMANADTDIGADLGIAVGTLPAADVGTARAAVAMDDRAAPVSANGSPVGDTARIIPESVGADQPLAAPSPQQVANALQAPLPAATGGDEGIAVPITAASLATTASMATAAPMISAAPTVSAALIPEPRRIRASGAGDALALSDPARAASGAAANPGAASVTVGAALASFHVEPSHRAATEPPATDPTAMDRALANQVGRAVLRTASDGSRQMVLRLTPPELGTVRITLLEQGGTLTAHLHADDDGVRMALDKLLPQLRSDLRSDSPVRDVALGERPMGDRSGERGGDDRPAAERGFHDRQQQARDQSDHRPRRDGPVFALDGVAPRPTPSPSLARALGGRADARGVDAHA